MPAVERRAPHSVVAVPPGGPPDVRPGFFVRGDREASGPVLDPRGR